MSMFNADQRAYMQSLARIPEQERCWCAWYRLGECDHCAPGRTLAMRRDEECPVCGSYPSSTGRDIVHRKGCAKEVE